MDYDYWIRRERRLRIYILKGSPTIKEEKKCRVCQDCVETCLCHEEVCPNCNSTNISWVKFDLESEIFSPQRIRCQFRYSQIAAL